MALVWQIRLDWSLKSSISKARYLPIGNTCQPLENVSNSKSRELPKAQRGYHST